MADSQSNSDLTSALAVLRKKGRIIGSVDQIHGQRTTDIDGVPRTDAEVFQMAYMEEQPVRSERQH